MSVKIVRNVLLGIALVVLVWVWIAPYLCDYGIIRHLDGQIASIDHQNLWNSLNPISGSIYFLGDLLCHQMESRCFILNGNEMPFCVRDIGLLMGFIIGMCVVSVTDLKRCRETDIFVLGAFGLIVLDWAIQKAFSLNVAFTRVATGLIAGIAIAFIVCFLINTLSGEPSYNKVYKQQ